MQGKLWMDNRLDPGENACSVEAQVPVSQTFWPVLIVRITQRDTLEVSFTILTLPY